MSGQLHAAVSVFPLRVTPFPIMKFGGPLNVSEHFGKDTVLLILPRIEPQFLGRPEVFLNVSTALRRSPTPSCEPLQHAGMHICEPVCPAVPRSPLCLSVELILSTGSPRIFTQSRRKEFCTKGNNKPDLRENRILQWHFAWKKATRQSNSRPMRGVLPSVADQYKVSSRAQTYRHSISICINS